MRMVYQLALVAVLTGGVAMADEWAKTFTVAGKPDLRVETDDGSVTVRTAEDGRVSARVTTSGWKIGPGDVEVQEHQAGNRVDLVVRRPHRLFSIDVGNRWIRLELLVPRRIDSDIHTGDGGIDITGVDGETRLRTGDGHIEVDSLDGSLKAETGDGHVRVRGRLSVLSLQTGDGSVQLDVLPGSKMSSAWRVVTGDGSVTIRLPADFGTELDAHTGDGSITVDLPASAGVRGRHEKDVNARLNGGGAPFSVRTQDGSIRIGLL